MKPSCFDYYVIIFIVCSFMYQHTRCVYSFNPILYIYTFYQSISHHNPYWMSSLKHQENILLILDVFACFRHSTFSNSSNHVLCSAFLQKQCQPSLHKSSTCQNRYWFPKKREAIWVDTGLDIISDTKKAVIIQIHRDLTYRRQI